MALWLETLGILLVALAGICVGLAASKRSTRTCLVVMIISLCLIGLILLARQDSLWQYVPALCALAAGRMRFVLLVFAVTMGLSAPLNQLGPGLRMTACTVMCVLIAAMISLPFLLPAMLQQQFATSQTRIDVDGVCRQTQPYTCGPAAAVSALNRLGLEAQEGTLATQARTGPVIGTSPWDLYRAIDAIYSSQGLSCAFERLSGLEQIPSGGVLLAIVSDRFALDHCVAVLGFDEQTVTLADPAEGLVHMPRPQFAQSWRNCGIVLYRAL
ncbi:MAG: C39 family peptidase [Planctomycetaceae bacterium]|nr:C39 family peptidase [Planctomycetaceae bacterium]